MPLSNYETMTRKVKKHIRSGLVKEADELLDAWIEAGFSLVQNTDYGADALLVSLLRMGLPGQEVLWRCLDRNKILPTVIVTDYRETILHVASGLKDEIALPFLNEWHARGLTINPNPEKKVSPIGVALCVGENGKSQKISFNVLKKLIEMGFDPWCVHQAPDTPADAVAPAWICLFNSVTSDMGFKNWCQIVDLFSTAIFNYDNDFPVISNGFTGKLSFAGLVVSEISKASLSAEGQNKIWKIVEILPKKEKDVVFKRAADVMLKEGGATDLGLSLFIKRLKDNDFISSNIEDKLLALWNNPSGMNDDGDFLGDRFYVASLKHIISLGGLDSGHPKFTKSFKENFESRTCYLYDRFANLFNKAMSVNFNLEDAMKSASGYEFPLFNESPKSIEMLLNGWIKNNKKLGIKKDFDLTFLLKQRYLALDRLVEDLNITKVLKSAGVLSNTNLWEFLTILLATEKDVRKDDPRIKSISEYKDAVMREVERDSLLELHSSNKTTRKGANVL